MAAVNPVEIADGQHCAVERMVGRRFATDHDERVRWLLLVGHGGRERGLGSGIDHGPACHRKTGSFVQANGAGYQFSRRMTDLGTTPAAAKMSESTDVSGLLRAPSSSAWMPAVTNRESIPKASAPLMSVRTESPIASTRWCSTGRPRAAAAMASACS